MAGVNRCRPPLAVNASCSLLLKGCRQIESSRTSPT